ncbi:AAA family ATPase [Mesorhizobium sp.]|uniref:AAA family ATPase n=1 Tax=Mesorhizobium sp. TaxID=1871066 RepID=UPI000FE3A4D5|nr:AAA family ATPase [Mesorhizobium sp.]RWG90561.1 MAG: hypothetical protein EOQ70_05225 [Mesorhizobium sp.]RWK13562.1 MAG: hypothetical protein EOR41_31980 [Mesorhizobium sp.]
MRLSTVYARFYKSFNFDHLRKASLGGQPKGDWEMFRGAWYPYVEVDFDTQITTIVGANESGKSHLLSAIEKAVSGEGFEQRDLCRYSPFFSVEQGASCWPHLGIGWTRVEPGDAERIARITKSQASFDHFMMFWETPDFLDLWIPDAENGWAKHQVARGDAAQLASSILPKPFRIMPDVALPAAVPMTWLSSPDAQQASRVDRRSRATLLDSVFDLSKFLVDDNTAQANGPRIRKLLSPLVDAHRAETLSKESERSLRLARGLLIDLAHVDPARLSELHEAIADGKEGYANALVEGVNDLLERNLNFKKWWVQDRDFSLKVTPREHELVFTIRDRTGTEYTFDERSSGLKYFLSYLIQAQSHQPQSDRESILLMDEPDTYLSAEAQQDLLKVLQGLAEPQDERHPVQVVYVTHSPFLLDKNHAERIRVLEKGRGYDGTRVVRNVSRNHYEPLRSAFGAFVGETAFVGSVNLLVEGVTDQVVLAGAARQLRILRPGVGAETLDLNNLVIVPCGSASEVVYMLYLVRGRDAEKPAVVALLDSDGSGDEAARQMRTDKKAKRLIDPKHVLQLGELQLVDGVSIKDLEDLIPVNLAAAAMNACIAEVTRFRETETPSVTVAEINTKLKKAKSSFDALQQVAGDKGGHIEKLGFARALIEVVEQRPDHLVAEIDEFLTRMAKLFRAINKARREAQREADRERLNAMVMRYHRIFGRDHKTHATREQGAEILEEIESQLDDTPQSDMVRVQIQMMQRRHSLAEDPAAPIGNFGNFMEDLANLRMALDLGDEGTEVIASAVKSAAAAASDAVKEMPIEGPEV